MAKTLCSQGRGPGFDPWLGNWIPHATTKKPWLQLRPDTNKQVNFKKTNEKSAIV